MERERAEARRAAGVGPDDWVNDWWVGEKEGEVERKSKIEEGEMPEVVDEDGGEIPDGMEGVERGGNESGL